MSGHITGKYIKYAIGEIVLVVIGILIALQINNWNENRKATIVKDNYLKQVVMDLELDKNYYQSVSDRLEAKDKVFKGYRSLFENPGLNITEIFSYIKTNFNGWVTYVEINTSTIKTLITTGDIHLIDNPLRSKLITYLGKQESSVNLYQNDSTDFQKIAIESAKKGIYPDLIKRLQNQPEFTTSLGIENNIPEAILELDSWITFTDINEKAIIKDFNGLIEDVNELISLIDAEK